MNELLIVGRGGEGVVLASLVLADALARGGAYVQAFPEFTAERRGAPISAFVRWDDTRPIRRRYKIADCDVLVDVSQSPPADDVLARVRRGGHVLVNRERRLPLAGAFEVVRAPASRIARDHRILSAEGRPLANAAMLGACMRIVAPAGLELLEQAIRHRTDRLVEANIAAARAGYACCTRQRTLPGDRRIGTRAAEGPTARPDPPLFPVGAVDSTGRQTGAWSFERPVLLEACTACALCALFCPEAALTRRDGRMVVDYDHCKGCGICAEVCPVREALRMDEVAA